MKLPLIALKKRNIHTPFIECTLKSKCYTKTFNVPCVNDDQIDIIINVIASIYCKNIKFKLKNKYQIYCPEQFHWFFCVGFFIFFLEKMK